MVPVKTVVLKLCRILFDKLHRTFLLLSSNYIFRYLSVRRSSFIHILWYWISLLLLSNYIFRYLGVRRFLFFHIGGCYDPCLHCKAYCSSTAISHCLGPFWRCHVLLMSWQTYYCFINSSRKGRLPEKDWFRIFFYNSVNIFNDISTYLCFSCFFIFLESILIGFLIHRSHW